MGESLKNILDVIDIILKREIQLGNIVQDIKKPSGPIKVYKTLLEFVKDPNPRALTDNEARELGIQLENVYMDICKLDDGFWLSKDKIANANKITQGYLQKILEEKFTDEIPNHPAIENQYINSNTIRFANSNWDLLLAEYDPIWRWIHKYLGIYMKDCVDVPKVKPKVKPFEFEFKNIGYDFDGVLHTDVTEADASGHRHPIGYGSYTPFEEIISKIIDDYNQNHNLFIITARSSKDAVINYLEENGNTYLFDKSNIISTALKPKEDILKDKKINVFYDDSCINIRSIYEANKAGKLPDLEELYIVQPENLSWYLINDSNIDTYCPKPSVKPPTKPPTKPLKKDIKVLTYNISWEAMTGINKGVSGAQCGRLMPNTCNEKIAKFIDNNGPYDFVALQEASRYQNIIQKSNALQQMINLPRDTKNIKTEDMVTFYDGNKYQLDDGINRIDSYMKDAGRPIQILFFKQKLCFVNIHAGHQNDARRLTDYINNTLEGKGHIIFHGKISPLVSFNGYKNTLTQKEQSDVKDKLKTYDIIITGDFNDNLSGHYLKFLDRQFYGKTIEYTCCDNSLRGSGHWTNYDHILFTRPGGDRKVLNPGKLTSDHLPVITTLPVGPTVVPTPIPMGIDPNYYAIYLVMDDPHYNCNPKWGGLHIDILGFVPGAYREQIANTLKRIYNDTKIYKKWRMNKTSFIKGNTIYHKSGTLNRVEGYLIGQGFDSSRIKKSTEGYWTMYSGNCNVNTVRNWALDNQNWYLVMVESSDGGKKIRWMDEYKYQLHDIP